MIKEDIKYVIRDIIGVGGGSVRLREGQSYGDYLKQNHGKVNTTNNETPNGEGEGKETTEGENKTTNETI